MLWLNERDLDIRCVRIRPYQHGESLILDVEQIIPLPEAANFQVQIQKKQREVRESAEQGSDWTRYDVTIEGQVQQKLYKREVMLAAVSQLISLHKSPIEIEEVIGRKVFEEAAGNVGTAAFEAELIARHPKDTKIAKRFFIQEEQLFYLNEKTYALTNQWSKDLMESALAALGARFGDYSFFVKETS